MYISKAPTTLVPIIQSPSYIDPMIAEYLECDSSIVEEVEIYSSGDLIEDDQSRHVSDYFAAINAESPFQAILEKTVR